MKKIERETEMIKASQLDKDQNCFTQTVDAGDYFIRVIQKGQTIRIVDLKGNQAADTLFFNADDVGERYSLTDTIREQGNIYLTAGTLLKTNENNDLLEITADTCGRHDTVGGACSSESNTVRYDLQKRHMHSCRDSWMLAIQEHESFQLNKDDITHNINFFMNVPITEDGGLTFEDGISSPGKYVELKAHMNVLVLLSNCPQLNNPCNGYNPTPIEIIIWNCE
ncbi:MAG: urea carboxylase-associated protein 1 [Cellvibrionaceae bacterium]